MPGPLLILDLSSALYVGVWDGARVAASRIRPQGTRGENAHALIDECLAEAGLAPGGLAAIAPGVGPGSFTGIRVCGALALGLAFARRLPLHPFGSLEALEAGLGAAPGRAVSAISANPGKWYVRVRGGAEALLATEALLALGGPDAVLAVSGEVPERERLARAFGTIASAEDAYPFAAVAGIALSRPPVPGGALRPNYLAASAAEEKRRAAAGASGETSP